MEQPGPSGGCGRLADPPRDVQVTIIRAPRGRAARAGVELPVRAVVTLVLLVAAVAAVLSSTPDSRAKPARAATAVPIAAGGAVRTPAAAAVYRFPLGCLGASLSAGAVASDAAGRAGPCWRYGVFLTAVLRQSHGVWRLGLEAVSRSCPRISLPASVRAQLVACRRQGAASPARPGPKSPKRPAAPPSRG
jgi:hypothetical protein